MPAAQPTESGTSTQKPAARQDPSWRTLLFCLAGSVPTGLGIAALEASMFGGAVLPLMGLLTVLALPLSLLVLFGVWLLFRPGLPSLSELLESKQSRLRLALLGPLTSVSLFTIAHLV